MPFDNSTYQPIPEGHRRLLVLAEFLETRVPEGKFDMGRFGIYPPDSERGVPQCAGAWASTIPEFNAAGLHWKRVDGTSFYEIHYAGKKCRDALLAFFDVPRDAFLFIGHGDSYDPKAVAARYRAFVAAQAKVTA